MHYLYPNEQIMLQRIVEAAELGLERDYLATWEIEIVEKLMQKGFVHEVYSYKYATPKRAYVLAHCKEN